MVTDPSLLANATEVGILGIMNLKRYWDKAQLNKAGKLSSQAFPEEWNIDKTMLAVLGLGLEQTIRELYFFTGNFTQFEEWILQTSNGHPDPEKVSEFNAYILNRGKPFSGKEQLPGVLDEADMACWQENGYVIVREAISRQDGEAAINAVCDFLEIDAHDPKTWYRQSPNRQGIMVQLFQHPALEKNRRSPRIRAAFEQLWGRTDLWMNTDRAGFNPPQTESWKFPGPDLHWDVSIELPIPFGTQGILYLADTAANQGAFTLVPGFHHRMAAWVDALPPGTNPRTQDLHALGAIPIVANAGDFIIWHQALPHGSSVNTSRIPRFVQYVNYAPLDIIEPVNWK